VEGEMRRGRQGQNKRTEKQQKEHQGERWRKKRCSVRARVLEGTAACGGPATENRKREGGSNGD